MSVTPVDIPAVTGAPVDSGSAGSPVDTASAADTGASTVAGAEPVDSAADLVDAAPAPSFPSADEFEWDSWDNTPDALPEEIRPWHSKFDAMATDKYGQLKTELDSTTELYNTLLTSSEDPRVQQLSAELENYKAKQEALSTEHANLQKTHNEYQELVQQYSEQQARQSVDVFKQKNGDLWENKELQAEFLKLLDVDMDAEYAAQISRLGPKAVETALEFKAMGAPDNAVMKSISLMGASRPAPIKPRVGATLTSGADKASNGTSTKKSLSDITDMNEFRLAVARKHIKRHS